MEAVLDTLAAVTHAIHIYRYLQGACDRGMHSANCQMLISTS